MDEVADQLRSLKVGGMLAGANGVEISHAGTVRVSIGSGGPDALARELNALVSERRETHLPLKGIDAVRATNGFVELSLHGSSEPPLLEIGPGNSVACHLVSPPATVSESVTA